MLGTAAAACCSVVTWRQLQQCHATHPHALQQHMKPVMGADFVPLVPLMPLAPCLYCLYCLQDMGVEQYEAKKELVANQIIERLDAVFPGLKDKVAFKEVSEEWRIQTHLPAVQAV